MRLRLPGPGLLGLVAALILGITVVLSLYLPYRAEQSVLNDFQVRLGYAVGPDVDMIGPEFLDPYVDNPWLAWLRRTRGLRMIDTSGGPARGLENLQRLPHCEHVYLSGFEIDADHLQDLIAAERLRILAFEDCEFTSEALHGLDGHPRLETIAITTSKIEDQFLSLPSVTTLRTFRGHGAGLRELDVSRTIDLRRIEVKNCGFDDFGAARLVDAPHLEVLMMPDTWISDVAIDDLLQLKSLRYIDLRLNNQLSTEAVAKLAELPELETVNLWYTVPERESAELLQTLPQAVWRQTP